MPSTAHCNSFAGRRPIGQRGHRRSSDPKVVKKQGDICRGSPSVCIDGGPRCLAAAYPAAAVPDIHSPQRGGASEPETNDA